MIIYKITNLLNGKVYIGQTQNSLNRRMRNHFSLNRKASNSPLHHAIKKYGKDSFTVEILACARNIEDLNYLESYFINLYNCISPVGYNLTYGGDSHVRSKETCEKISKAKKGIPNLKLKNVPKSLEHKIKLRLAKLNKKQTESHRKNSAKARLNKNLKPIVAVNNEECIVFSGFKYLTLCNFERSSVFKSLKTGKLYKGYNFYYFNEVQ